MAQTQSQTLAPITEEAFAADRQHFLDDFIAFSKWTIIALIVLLILMAIFLV
jgi:hypothetical protein